MFKCTFSFRTIFFKMIKRKPSSDVEVVSSSNLSPEMEARIARLPKSWQAGCREVMEEQTPELQLIQIDIYEGLVSLANSLSCPPSSSTIKELVNEVPRPVAEDDLNMDDCLGWFRGTEGEYDDEEEDEEDFDEGAPSRWLSEEWQQCSDELIRFPHILPDNLRHVKIYNAIVEDAPAFVDHSALPILITPPPSIPSPLALTCDVVKPLQRAVRTKRRSGISMSSAQAAIPSPILVQRSHPTKTKTMASKRVNRPTAFSIRTSATHDWQPAAPPKSLRKQTSPEDQSRELQGAEPSCHFPIDISYSDFAQELDERRTMFNALAQLSILPLRRPATSAKRIVSLTAKRTTSYSGRRLAGKENWQQLNMVPLLQRAIPTTLGDVIPRVEDPQPSSWCHLAMDGDLANGLDERHMLFDDASTIMQDWD